MIRLTVTLAVALYATFIIWGEPAEYTGAEAATTDDPAGLTQTADFVRPVILESNGAGDAVVTRAVTQDVVVPDAAVIAASAPEPSALDIDLGRIGEPVVVSLFRDVAPAPEPAAAAPPDTEGDLLRVTGTVVNMRAGPSTGNAVVDSLPRGTITEALGAPENGWQQIRDIATGQTGWMAARFLEPS
ncbi:MAG: SH3 domain-containing protein [Pseudomonadota bacterium]